MPLPIKSTTATAFGPGPKRKDTMKALTGLALLLTLPTLAFADSRGESICGEEPAALLVVSLPSSSYVPKPPRFGRPDEEWFAIGPHYNSGNQGTTEAIALSGTLPFDFLQGAIDGLEDQQLRRTLSNLNHEALEIREAARKPEDYLRSNENLNAIWRQLMPHLQRCAATFDGNPYWPHGPMPVTVWVLPTITHPEAVDLRTFLKASSREP